MPHERYFVVPGVVHEMHILEIPVEVIFPNARWPTLGGQLALEPSRKLNSGVVRLANGFI